MSQDPTRLYHGGPAGLEVGEGILPSGSTGATSHRDFQHPLVPTRSDRVYLASSPWLALIFTARLAQGAVYEVAPDGELEPDPDFQGEGLSWQAEGATVVRWVRQGLTPRERRQLESIGRHAAKRLGARSPTEVADVDLAPACAQILRDGRSKIDHRLAEALIERLGGKSVVPR